MPTKTRTIEDLIKQFRGILSEGKADLSKEDYDKLILQLELELNAEIYKD